MTINLSKIHQLNSNKIGFFRFKKFDKDFLITNDAGGYSFLSEKEFGEFISGKLVKGPKYKELKEKLFIKYSGYKEKLSDLLAKKFDYINFGPSLHIIVVTLRCNHKCKYCHAAAAPMTAKNMDMTEDIAKKVVDTIFFTSSNSISIEFQGGEPLINFDIVKFIITYAKEKAVKLDKKVTFSLVSNLTLMSDEILDFLVKNDIGVATSLDGDEMIHNYNRTFKEGNSFKLVTSWIKKIDSVFKKNKEKLTRYKVSALITVTKKSLTYHKEIIDTYLNLGLDCIFLRYLNPYGFALPDMQTIGYTEDKFIDFYVKSMDYILEINKKGKYFREIYSVIFLYKILTEYDPNYLDERSPCGAGIGQVAYNYDGRIYTCDEGRMLGRMGIEDFKLGEVLEEGSLTYENIINSNVTKIMVASSITDSLPGYNDSVYKPYMGVCPIYNYKVNGNIYPNFSLNKRRKINTAVLDYLFDKLKNEEYKKIFIGWVNKSFDKQKQNC